MNLTSPTLRHLRRPSSIIVAVMACATWLGLGALVSASAQATSGAPLKITTLTTKSYGTILESTRTVYTLAPSKVACTATCLKYWPEVLLPKGATKAVAGPGVAAAKLVTRNAPTVSASTTRCTRPSARSAVATPELYGAMR